MLCRLTRKRITLSAWLTCCADAVRCNCAGNGGDHLQVAQGGGRGDRRNAVSVATTLSADVDVNRCREELDDRVSSTDGNHAEHHLFTSTQ